MQTPNQVRNAANEALRALRHDPEYNLRPYYRLLVYESFGPTAYPHDLSEQVNRAKQDRIERIAGDRARGWLCYITALHVLPIWEAEIPQMLAHDDGMPVDLPIQIVHTVRAVLSGSMPSSEGFELLCGDFYSHWNLDGDLRHQVWCADVAAYIALEKVLGLDNEVINWPKLALTTESPNDAIRGNNQDVVSFAAAAWSITDPNPAGYWTGWKEGYSVMPFQRSKKKRREFWEWWLTAAVDEAWKMLE